jgi:hypothetical protein
MLIGPAKSLGDDQSRMNNSTRGQWDWYAAHRAHIERLIVPETRDQRICILGAGNCNDLDLKWLVQAYAQVHLVDIDRSALDRAVHRQGVSTDRLTLHAPIDLTGIADQSATWTGRSVSEAEVDRAAQTAAVSDLASIPGGPFDLVLSPCVLSQLLCSTRDLLGKSHPAWPRLKTAIRAGHLRTITAMLKPAGRAVLVVDLASTKGIPGLERATDHDLPGIMEMSIETGKCFRGLEPRELTQALHRAGAAAEVEISAPWLWHLGLAKAFLCYALVARRRRLQIPNAPSTATNAIEDGSGASIRNAVGSNAPSAIGLND